MSDAGDIDTLAAEYVLGTLDAGERARTQALLAVDHALAAKVRIWERRLSELHLMVEPIEPDNEVWTRIRRKIPALEPAKPTAAPPFVAPKAAPVAARPAPAFSPAATPATVVPPIPATPPVPAMEFKPAPLPAIEPAPLPAIEPVPAAAIKPTLPPVFAPPPAAAPWSASLLDQPLPVTERPSLESLEEAVLRAADDLQRRATAEPAVAKEPEPAVEPVPEPVAEPMVETAAEPAEAPSVSSTSRDDDRKAAAETATVPEPAAKGPEESVKPAETPEPAASAVERKADREPSTGGVASGDLPPPAPALPPVSALPPASGLPPASVLPTEPTPGGPLAAFPTPFSATAPASIAPAASAATLATPTVAPPSPAAVRVRPAERLPAQPKSHWLARTVATLATLILLASAGLVAAWRFAPERVPTQLQPVELLKAAGIAVPVVVIGPPPRKPAPPESFYEE